MKNCFLCGTEYDETNRGTITELTAIEDGEEKPFTLSYIRVSGKCLALCPACTCAAAFGIAITSQNLIWNGPFEFEDVDGDSLPAESAEAAEATEGTEE